MMSICGQEGQIVINQKLSYCEAIHAGFDYLLSNYPEVFVMGQGLWSPWYVGNTMKGLEDKYGKHRVLDTPVSELATTGAGVGAATVGMKPIIVHPRMDFMLYAMDPIVNQAAKWSYMFGGQASAGVTIRSIINRGGEQGAQHSQALHAWFSHIPGLRVVMPASVKDARDMLIASVLSRDPVIYIDDRALYNKTDTIGPIEHIELSEEGPKVTRIGSDITLVGSGFCVELLLEAADKVSQEGVSAEVIDLRVLSPYDSGVVNSSAEKTGRLLVVDGGWKSCGFAGEVIASAFESIDVGLWKSKPARITLPNFPAPCSKYLEQEYYPDITKIISMINKILN
jgi:pyruvate/2-oxoglutarate/acetoin dehydrogenase E1 component